MTEEKHFSPFTSRREDTYYLYIETKDENAVMNLHLKETTKNINFPKEFSSFKI